MIGVVVYFVLGWWMEVVIVRKVGMLNGVVEGKCKSVVMKV